MQSIRCAQLLPFLCVRVCVPNLTTAKHVKSGLTCNFLRHSVQSFRSNEQFCATTQVTLSLKRTRKNCQTSCAGLFQAASSSPWLLLRFVMGVYAGLTYLKREIDYSLFSRRTALCRASPSTATATASHTTSRCASSNATEATVLLTSLLINLQVVAERK